jgi:hypothetical protein
MRGDLVPTCLSCGIKHLAKAKGLMLEARQGYPDHWLDAVGEMALASDELLETYPREAAMVRQERLLLMLDPEHYNPRLNTLLRWIGRLYKRKELCDEAAGYKDQ